MHAGRLSSSIFSSNLLSLFLIKIFTHSSAIVIPSEQDIYTNDTYIHPNITTIRSLSLSNVSTVSDDRYRQRCALPYNWYLLSLRFEHCMSAVQYLYFTELKVNPGESFEFRAPGSQPSTHSKTQWTPRKYSFGKELQQYIHVPMNKKRRDLPDKFLSAYQSSPFAKKHEDESLFDH